MPWGPLPVSAFAERALTVIAPRPPVTGAGHFGLLIPSGGLSFERAFLFTRPTGACCHQNLQTAAPITHRLLRPYLFGAEVVGQMPCHGSASVGGVRAAQIL